MLRLKSVVGQSIERAEPAGKAVRVSTVPNKHRAPLAHLLLSRTDFTIHCFSKVHLEIILHISGDEILGLRGTK